MKYLAILSNSAFWLTVWIVVLSIPGFNPTRETVSHLVTITDPFATTVLYFASVFKFVLDLYLSYFVLKHFHTKLFSIAGLSWTVPYFSFISIPIFPTDRFRVVHLFFASLLFLLWLVAQYIFAQKTNSKNFKRFTMTILAIQLGILITATIMDWFNTHVEFAVAVLSVLWIQGLMFTQTKKSPTPDGEHNTTKLQKGYTKPIP